MRPHRGYLFWGFFFILLGGIPLAARQGWIDASQWGEIGRLWPLIVIAIGVVILLSRTQLALVVTSSLPSSSAASPGQVWRAAPASATASPAGRRLSPRLRTAAR